MIIITTQCFFPKIGGIESLMTGMADAMSSVDKDVLVLADGKKNSGDQKKRYKIKRFSGWKPYRRRRKAIYLKKMIENNNIEAIYADSWKSVEYLNQINTKIVVLAHGTEIPKKYFDNFYAYLNVKKRRIIKSYANCDKIAANSAYTRDLMIASLKIDYDKIKIIHPGIDVYEDFISDEDRENVKKIIKDADPIITTLARVEKRKGHKFVINAISKLKSKFPNMLYLVAGKGPYLEEIKKYVIKLHLEKNVKFLGWITEPEKSLVLQNSDIFIMTPSQVGESIEGFGMVFIDAAFHGIASIGTQSGGISDAVINNKTGLLCEEGNQDRITKNIDKLLSNRELRIELGTNGKERAKREYSWSIKVREYLDI
ncbi:glycosyltransferase family 4 protein [Pelagibacteraceae bacterium]|nr:glycosyltransferase family 4 protein [Pelagibacteraceae bacterium]